MDVVGALNESKDHSPRPTLPFSPKQFLKMRRPERFSDTVSISAPALDRAMLEYHLDTLTSRNEELLFERFAKALLQRTVCPNLVPHTGPSGGGDSKVDSETFPVAPILALSWYVGEPEIASSDRWAFAFSSKKKWRPKVESDVGKIVATQRAYSKAFFVSNQFIRDKSRAEVEDALSSAHSIDVRIFDRTWILDQIFDNKLESIAVDELQIKTELRRQDRKGPRDIEREREFNEVEEEIKLTIQEARQSPILVDKALLAADLARGIERPRHEIDGLYARAERMANAYGTEHQKLLCSYQRAWTSHWWHEDFDAFLHYYDEVEHRAQGSQNPYELELWFNLFTCLFSQSQALGKNIELQSRANLLLNSIETIAQQHDRPSASLYVQSLSIHLQLLTANSGKHDDLLDRLADLVKNAEGLIGYPFEPLSKIVTELGTVYGSFQGYQRLFEATVSAAALRSGDVSAARMMLQRGMQQMDSGNPNDAIRMFGRVMGKLFKHESRDDAVGALYLCSYAYEQVGLLWAARGTALAAASIATNDYWTYESLTPHQAACYNRIKWIELRLGRLGPMLAWHELDLVVGRALTNLGLVRKDEGQDDLFDPVSGMLLLKADLETLRDMTRLPAVLDSVGLPMSAVALIFALGHEGEVPPELFGGEGGDDERLKFFTLWRDQPAQCDLPLRPKIDLSQTIQLESSIAGCTIECNCRNESPFIELGESLLACLEALLATAISDGIIAREPFLKIKIRKGEFAEVPFTFEAKDVDGRPTVEIRCRPFSPHRMTVDQQTQLKIRLFEVMTHILARAFLLRDAESLLTKLFQDDLAPQRALDFTTSFVVVGNVLGSDAKTSLNRWIDPTARNYPLRRTEVWDQANRDASATSKQTTDLKFTSPGSGLPSEKLNLDQVTHREIRMASLIREAIWDDAKWRGVAFGTALEPTVPPILALLFENSDAGSKIFKEWQTELGGDDDRNRLRVAILRNIRRDNPHWYRVVIGNDPADLITDGVKNIVMVSRVNTMEPDSGENLKRFISAYKNAGSYILTQAKLNCGELQFMPKNQIFKTQIEIREAWEVGPNDPDIVGIWSNDDPLIPDGIQDPPVVQSLERIRHSRQGIEL